jgi:hypothetical protein
MQRPLQRIDQRRLKIGWDGMASVQFMPPSRPNVDGSPQPGEV